MGADGGQTGACAAALLLTGTVANSAEEETPDFSGVWLSDQGVLYSDPTPGVASGAHPAWDDSINPPPLTPDYARQYEEVKQARLEERAVADYTANCVPPGMPRLMVNPYPFEILHTDGRVTMIWTTDNHVRRIFTDGREHDTEFLPKFAGSSIGHWEGGTLVVETIGLREDTTIQSTGIPHSGELKIIERIRLIDENTLEDQVMMIDPIAFYEPYQSTRTYSRLEGEEIQEYVCAENNRASVDKYGNRVE